MGGGGKRGLKGEGSTPIPLYSMGPLNTHTHQIGTLLVPQSKKSETDIDTFNLHFTWQHLFRSWMLNVAVWETVLSAGTFDVLQTTEIIGNH